MTVCCEHNRCPDRPHRWLRRFRTRPWFCDQCGRLWVTVPKAMNDHRWWEWRDLTVSDQQDRANPTVEESIYAKLRDTVPGEGWANAGPPIGLYPTRFPVHNHGVEQGAGLSCRERWVDGRLVGECLDVSDSEDAG